MMSNILNISDEEVRNRVIQEFRLKHKTSSNEDETNIQEDVSSSIDEHISEEAAGDATYVNDIDGLKSKLDEIEYKPPKGLSHVPWVDKLSITSQLRAVPQALQKDTGQDIARETHFFNSAKIQVTECLKRLTTLGIPFSRPMDFLAEMLKSDKQMQKVRTKIVDEQQRIETVDIRRQKQLSRKFKREDAGKMNNRVKRQEEYRKKNDNIREIEDWKKERTRLKSVAEDGDNDASNTSKKKLNGSSNVGFNSKYYNPKMHIESAEQSFDRFVEEREKKTVDGLKLKSKKSENKQKFNKNKSITSKSSKNRKIRDAKFGFGGRKRNQKRNDVSSFTDVGKRLNGKRGKTAKNSQKFKRNSSKKR